MRRVKLMGDVSDVFGAEYSISVSTPYEALRAIDCNKPGFIDYINQNPYVVLLVSESGNESKEIDKDNAISDWGEDQVLMIVPKTDGNITAIFAAVAAAVTSAVAAVGIVGFAATAIGWVVGAIAVVALAVGVSSVLSLITGALFGGNDPSLEREENRPNYFFNGPVNTSRQGGRVPLFFGGPMMVGSMIVSGRIFSEDDVVTPEEAS